MKDILNKFDIYHNASDISQALCDFKKDTENVTLLSSTFLYIGYQARFNAFYFYADTLNSNSSSFTFEYYDLRDGWKAIPDVFDDTLAFTRNGFVEWRELPDWEKAEINGANRFWVRISTNTDTSLMSIRALNIIFSTDDELQKVYYPIGTDSSFKLGADDFMLIHEDVRNAIVQKFRNRGLRKLEEDQERWLRITPLDILDIQEVRQAATYFALSRIFFNVSDSVDDSWSVKSREMQAKADDFLDIAYLSFDKYGKGDTNAMPFFNTGILWQ